MERRKGGKGGREREREEEGVRERKRERENRRIGVASGGGFKGGNKRGKKYLFESRFCFPSPKCTSFGLSCSLCLWQSCTVL